MWWSEFCVRRFERRATSEANIVLNLLQGRAPELAREAEEVIRTDVKEL